ncbi:16290_t:CDS:2 [Funneliformis geosporum]|uniref:16290_t:CDS:1 n=1 Tax=Funneliformis geosporum TaxID=1117311 RepID=A0A9W4T4X7_9GLOM|nr:16290_t:CDS:2 [Funneliformis geosporum]
MRILWSSYVSQICEWLSYDPNFLYPLLQAYSESNPESLLIFHVNLPKHIAICLSCKKPTRRNSGHSAIYTEYKSLTGTMNFSKNMRSLILYSEMIGACLS